MRSWLKAGLIGGVVLGAFTLVTTVALFLPLGMQTLISCCACGGLLILYPGIGVLAVKWLAPPRTAGQGAKEGALAGLVAGVVDGVVTLLAGVVSILLGASEVYLGQLPPELTVVLEEMGMLGMLSPTGLLTTIACTIPLSIAWSAVCAALGGVVYAAIWRE